ncbi:MAG TPA: FixH family protein [Candidatus Omnitrophota bacterium]|nr:FixH family protein [Candidatus Omnitrophota bacterium]
MAKARQPGWWYPYIFVGAFLVVIGVNGALAYFATSTFTGLETEGAYEKGLAYNTNLAMAKAQAELGWTVDTTVSPVAGEVPRAEIVITYKDRDGRPVDGLDVRAQLLRPTVKGHDHGVVLEPKGKGTYSLIHALPFKGVWDMDVAAIGKDVSYQHAKRFVIP